MRKSSGATGPVGAEQQALFGVAGPDLVVGQRDPVAGDQADLVEGQALADPDGEGERDDLQPEGAGVAGGDLVEGLAPVGDDPREDVEATGGALGVGAGPDVVGEVQGLLQGDEVRPLGLEDRALAA